MAAPQIISIGSINLDVQVRADGWPAKGKSGLGHDCLLVSGGKAANVAYLARHLGAAAQLIARVGDDPMVPHLLAPLEAMGVDLSHVKQTPGCLSGVALIMTAPDGEKSILLAPNANQTWTSEDEDHLADVIHRAPRGSVVVVDFEVSVSVAARAVEAAHAAGHHVVLDPAPPQDVPVEILAQAGYVTPDSSEAEQLAGIEVRDPDSAIAAAEAICRLGAGNVLVKLASGGCIVVGNGMTAQIETERVEPIDTTGAGDAFAATLAVALSEDRPLLEAAHWAVAAATIAVTRYGSQAAYPNRGEVEDQLARVSVRRT